MGKFGCYLNRFEIKIQILIVKLAPLINYNFTMTTKHQYIDLYPILAESKKLILGTIHPHDHHNFLVPFFYGNKLSIWNILNDAFPNELGQPISLAGIQAFLSKHKIAISDTIRECNRSNPTALDSDLIPTNLNYQLIDQIKNSNIDQIFFTSGFQKNNAFRLFYVDIIKQKLTKEIRTNREITLNPNLFGRPIKLTILYSPAGTANIGLSKSKIYLDNKIKYYNLKNPVQAFKIDYYKNIFQTTM
jgi:hypothetical protein